MSDNHDILTNGFEPSSKEALQRIVASIERINEDIAQKQDERKEFFAHAKAQGFEPKYIRAVIKMRKKEPAEIEEEASMIEVYMNALGDLDGTPLGEYAMRLDEVHT